MPPVSVVRFEIAPRSIVLVLASVAGVWLAWQLWNVELVLIVALILAGTFNPVIEWLERRGMRRGHALVLLLIAMLAAATGLVVVMVPPLTEQVLRLLQDAPATRTRLLTMLGQHPFTMPLTDAVRSAELRSTFIRVEKYLFSYSSQAVVVLGYGATTLVLAFYLLADRTRAQGALYAIVPRHYHMRLARILQQMETIVGGYMRGQLITCACIGVFTFVLLSVFRIPNALSLALFAALVDIIPFIGGLMVIVPAVVSALPHGVTVTGIVFGALLVYMEFESRILVPRVYGSVLRLPHTAVVLALIIGGTLMGIVGALLALPTAAGLLMALEELHVELPGDDSMDDPTRAKHAAQEATYEQMSAGATAPEAGEIAKQLTNEIQQAELAAAGGGDPLVNSGTPTM
jgi:predicted PurR-regulated permease PerM